MPFDNDQTPDHLQGVRRLAERVERKQDWFNNLVVQAQERWAPIPGTDGRWVISSLGRAKRLEECKFSRTPAGAIRSGLPTGGGYLQLHIKVDGKPRHVSMHRAVLEAFIGPCPDGCQVAHLNGDKTDNRLANLAYVTPAENQLHRILHGTDLRGSQTARAKLSDRDVREILASDETNVALGKRYGVTHQAIHLIRRGVNWKHASDPGYRAKLVSERDLHKHAFAQIDAAFRRGAK